MSKPPTKEELYTIYKELRDDGIIWTDAKASNVGRLNKSNKRYSKSIGEIDEEGNITWGSQKYAGTGVGFETQNENQDVLKTNEFVIIDLDYIFAENSEKIKWPGGGTISREFEERYLREKEKKIETRER